VNGLHGAAVEMRLSGLKAHTCSKFLRLPIMSGAAKRYFIVGLSTDRLEPLSRPRERSRASASALA
jgi:hypothetical protein